uniref:G-protein coupled receptors family 3 profile domain-containing protein n=1 Tax=Echeneis naucrates TaxID=173247 RepID=A0A665UJN3_ECHNA
MRSKVWIGSEDWSQTSVISGIPGIHTIGTVLGVSIKHAAISGFEDFERKVFLASVQESDAQKVCNGATSPSNDCLQSANLYSLAKNNFSLGKYDITSSFNVYKAVHAVAHALHKALDCDSGQCQGRRVYPWEVPLSICSPPCPAGHKKLLMGQHSCCFDCQACPGSTFLNIKPTMCQPCLPEQWAPPSSERCLNRTVLLLAWDAPISITLFFFLGVCLLMTCSSAVILLFNLNTPVAKSAGGRTCLLMLAGLSAAAMSSLCHFGQPSPLACILKQPLFIVSFTVCLASITMRSLQVVCIFKFASKLPPAYDKWAKKYGPEFTIILVSATMLFISVLRVVLDPPQPSQDLDFYKDRIVLECSNTFSPGAWLELTYVSILSALCFSFSYMGKDLPANYNEAKCITFSLMVYIISWMSFFTLYLISRDQFTMAAHVFAILFSVLVLFGGYFLPKIYIIVLKPQMNTTAHFQNCIQMYTMSK